MTHRPPSFTPPPFTPPAFRPPSPASAGVQPRGAAIPNTASPNAGAARARNSGRRALAAIAVAGGLGAFVFAGCAEGVSDNFARFSVTHNALASQGLVQQGPLLAFRLDGAGKTKLALELDAGCTTIATFAEEGSLDLRAELEREPGVPLAKGMVGAGLVRACVDSAGPYTLKLQGRKNAAYTLGTWVGGSGRAGGGQGGAVLTAAAGGAAAGATAKGTCEDPLALDRGNTNGDTRRGTTDHEGSCASNSSSEIVYRFEVTARKRFVAETNPRFDSVLFLRKDHCEEADAEIACNDDMEGSRGSRIDELLEPGVYYLFVDGTSGEQGTYALRISESDVVPLKDACARAPALVSGAEVRASTLDVDQMHTRNCGDDAKGPEKYYKFDVPARSRVRTRVRSGSFSPVVHLHDVCDADKAELACGDASEARGENRATALAVLDAGTYYAVADSKDRNARGQFQVQLDMVAAAGGGAPHDVCGDPEIISLAGRDANVDGDTFEAHDDTKLTCGGNGAGDVFYRFDITQRTHVSAEFSSEEGQHVMALQRGCAGAVIGCGETLDETLDPGSYTLIVDGKDDDTPAGRFNLALATIDVGPKETACRTAPLLRSGVPVHGSTHGGRDDFQPSCGGRGGAPDKVYKLVLTQRSKIDLVLETPRYDGVLAIRKSCFGASRNPRVSEVACNDDERDSQNRARIEQVLDAGTYLVVADGTGQNQEGDYTLTLRTTPAGTTAVGPTGSSAVQMP